MNDTVLVQENDCLLPLHTRVIGIIAVVLIMLIGIIGNIAVCIIIQIFKNAFETISYLFVINVAISDLLTSLTVLPFEIVYWLMFPVFPLGSKICRLWNALYFTFLAASSIGIYILGIDIYLAVTRPLHYQILVTKRRACSLIALNWVWSITIGVLIYFYQEEPPEGEYLFDLNSVAYGCYLFIHIVVPSLTVPIIYAKIFLIARKHQTKISPQDSRNCPAKTTLRQQLSMAKTFCFITVSFFVCWYPFLVVQLIYVFKLDENVDWCKLETADTIVCWFSYLQCCLNPMFYVFRRKKIRSLITKRLTKRQVQNNMSEATKVAVIEGSVIADPKMM